MVYADLQTRLGAPARYISRELGSVVIGEEAEFGATDQSNDQDRDTARDGDTGMTGAGEGVNLKIALNNLTGEPSRTLSDAKFVIGDYICCAILTPLADGSVAPAPLPPARGPAGRGGRENGFGRGDYAFGRGMRSGRYDDGGRGGRFDDGGRGGRYDDGGRGGRYDDRRGNGGLPVGEWRRGEAPPSEGYWRGGGRGRGRGRW
ncbi:hypothetical protein CC78DRAFT_537159 [Lojkania enalia]|uniref:Uncharacterized protein n=1 Tax=Lojkania enalia TaxID=147567 RepID=A0A9P4JZP0_9PLEO|nr:hypothetical protein CC78DRAFT_537159 [Didymosphaeria enalia]